MKREEKLVFSAMIKEMGCSSDRKGGNYGGVRVVGGSETVDGDERERCERVI